jgi:hypothetical protein
LITGGCTINVWEKKASVFDNVQAHPSGEPKHHTFLLSR